MAVKIPQTLVNELIQRKVLQRDQVAAITDAAAADGKEFSEALIAQNIISDVDLLKLKEEIYRLPAVQAGALDIDREALKDVAEETAKFYYIVPFARAEDVLKIGILNPEDIDTLEALKFIAQDKGVTVEKYLVSVTDFEKGFKQYATLTGEVGEALESLAGELAKKETKRKTVQSANLIDEISEEAPVTKIVAVIIRHAAESRASDIHIEPFEDRVRTRFRVDGILQTALNLPKNLHSAVVARIKILSDLKIDETRLAQDGRFSTLFEKKKLDFRVSTFPTKYGEKVVMRILDPLTDKVGLPELGVDGRSLRILEEAMAKPFGSILITGPTGSGKSTTLAGILKRMNSDEVNIVTLEDPIEYYVDGVNQSQVHEEIGYTFADGLRHILRQDPDVVMVGEIRDRETAGLATQAALTGHIMLSTLHTNDAMGVIPRLIDMGVEKYLIPPTLTAALAQRLLRRLCQTCRVGAKANSGEVAIINAALEDMPKEYHDKLFSESGYTIYKPNTKNPCRECGGKAFKGRIGIFEVLGMTDALEKIILGTLSEAAMREEAKRQGMITMFQDGIIKVLNGVVSLEELLEVAEANDSA